MGYRVKGTLKLPDGGSAQGLKVEFTAGSTSQTVLAGTKYTMEVGAGGVYDVDLEFGSYSVLGYVDGAYPLSMGSVVVDATTATGQTLTQLLGGTSDVPAAWVAQIELWLAQSKAEADRATTQANRAQSEADRAKQIADLDTVEDAVALASVPFPDVWIPFNDSLNMLAGYGTEIKVGTDVVARRVDFTRASAATYIDKSGVMRVADINEPRFEKEGLLIEEQSTNLFNRSAAEIFNWVSHGLTQSAGDANLPFTVFQIKITSSLADATIGVLVDLYNLPNPVASSGGKVTASVIMFGDADAIIAANPTMVISDVSNGVTSLVKLSSGMVRVVHSCTVQSGSPAVFASFQTRWLDMLPSVVLGCYQLEALPFATSYIPTNGAAATRAADLVGVPKALNNCAEFYSGKDALLPTVGADKITISPVTGKKHIRNVKGFFSPLTSSQKAALK